MSPADAVSPARAPQTRWRRDAPWRRHGRRRRRDRRRGGPSDRRRRHGRRRSRDVGVAEQAQRIDVGPRRIAAPRAEADLRPRDARAPAGPHRADALAADHARPATHRQRREMDVGGRQRPAGDGGGDAVVADVPGEGDRAPARRPHRRPGGRRDDDAAPLAGREPVGPEGEARGETAARGPRPGRRGGDRDRRPEGAQDGGEDECGEHGTATLAARPGRPPRRA